MRRAGPRSCSRYRWIVIESWQIAQTHGLPRAKFKSVEILKCTRQFRAPFVRADPRQRHIVDENRPGRWLVHLGEELDERGLAGAVLANDRDDRTGRQFERDVVEDQAGCARV